MLSEIELYFGGTETTGSAVMTLHIVEFETVTEITNYAYATMKKEGASGVSFGPTNSPKRKRPACMTMKAWQREIREQQAVQKPRPVIEDMTSAVVREIDRAQAKLVIMEYEWLGNMGTTNHYFGLFFGEELAGVTCFGHPLSPALLNICGKDNAAKVCLLSRGACVHWAHPHSASFLINESCRQMSKYGKFVFLAFADSDAGEIGTVYQASNWFYLGRGQGGEPGMIPPGGAKKNWRSLHSLCSAIRSREGRHKDATGRLCFTVGGKNYYHKETLPDGRYVGGSALYPFILRGGKTVAEAMDSIHNRLLKEGWKDELSNGKMVYANIFGDKRLKRALRKTLAREVLPYPKRIAGELQVAPPVPPGEGQFEPAIPLQNTEQ